MRYEFHVTDNKVICVSGYAGKAVRGIAKCSPEDTFDVETGKRLAQARCDYKIAKKRVLRSKAKFEEATKALGDAREYADKMQSYYDESFAEFVKLHNEIEAFEATL